VRFFRACGRWWLDGTVEMRNHMQGLLWREHYRIERDGAEWIDLGGEA